MDENTQESQKSASPSCVPKAEDYYFPGNTAERVDAQLGILTQGILECAVRASGAFPLQTEGEDAPRLAGVEWKSPPQNTFETARAAELLSAARLSEASARLIAGLSRYRDTYKQDFAIRHTSARADKDGGRLTTTISKHFSIPGQEEATHAQAEAAGLDGNLRKLVEALGARTTDQAAPTDNSALKELMRRLGVADGDGDNSASS